jgi:hypothetical protein
MKILRRGLGALVLLLSTVGNVGCVAGIIGIWIARQRASEKVITASARLDVALQRVSAANQNVQRALARARADVASVNAESANLSGGEENNRHARGALRMLMQREVSPKVNDLGGRMAAFSDAAVAASSLLQSLQEMQPGPNGHLNPEKLEGWADQASTLSAKLQQLQTAVGDGDKQVTQKDVAAASKEVDAALQNCQAMVDDWQSNLDSAQDGLPRLKSEILGWLTLIAIAVTVLCAWAGIGQISLFAHGWKWCCGA